jgi:hypothetical protein
MKEELIGPLGYAKEVSGTYLWNFKLTPEQGRIRQTLKRKIYKYALQHPSVLSVHRNGSITIHSKSETPAAIMDVDQKVHTLAARYHLEVEETNNLQVAY